MLIITRLTHNVHGPHDEKFHALLKELENEYVTVRRSGYSGEGFYSEGKRLGTGRSHNPSTVADARRKALAAAEKRRSLSAGSGQKLGGSKSDSANPDYQEIRERVAAAALRRAMISKTCGAESGASDRGKMEKDAEKTIENGILTRVEEDEDEDVNEQAILQAAIDLIEAGEREEAMRRKAWEERGGYVWIEDDTEPVLIPATAAVASSTAQSAGSKHSRSSSSESSPDSGDKRPIPTSPPFLDPPPSYEEALGASTWSCDLCTLINPAPNSNCDACGVQRPEEEVVEIIETPKRAPRPMTQVTRPGGLKRSTSVKKKERVRFGINPVTPAKRMWDCHNCTSTNDIEWWTCATCGVMKMSS